MHLHKNLNKIKCKSKAFLAVAALSVLLLSCGGHRDSDSHDSDTTAQADTTLVEDVAMPVLTPDSLGCIKVGMRVDSIPESAEGLYDSVEESRETGVSEHIFLTEGTPIFSAFDFGDGRVDMIALVSDITGAAVEDGELRIGEPFATVLSLPGVAAEWAGDDDMGRWVWRWRGLWFMPEVGQNGSIARRLSRSLYDSSSVPRSDDFTEDVTIGYIGTGLPF